MREVLSVFEGQGLVVRRHGVGTFAIHPSERIESGLEVLDTVEELAKKSGMRMVCGVLKVLVRPCQDNEGGVLRLQPDARVLQVTRVMKVQDHPVAYMSDVLPEGLLSTEELGENFDGSVLNQLLTRGDNLLASCHTTINTYLAKGIIAKALNVESGETLLRFSSTVYGRAREAVYVSDDFFLPNYFKFQVVRRVERFSLA
jgi:GntR family transcriptional regulator